MPYSYSKCLFRPLSDVLLLLAVTAVCQTLLLNERSLPVQAEGDWSALCSLCAACVLLLGGGWTLWYNSNLNGQLLPLSDVFVMQPPPQDVQLSHHPGIIGEQAASRAVQHEHISSARVCHAGPERLCWNVASHCISVYVQCGLCVFISLNSVLTNMVIVSISWYCLL